MQAKCGAGARWVINYTEIGVINYTHPVTVEPRESISFCYALLCADS